MRMFHRMFYSLVASLVRDVIKQAAIVAICFRVRDSTSTLRGVLYWSLVTQCIDNKNEKRIESWTNVEAIK